MYYHTKVHLDATPEEVYLALTTQAGLRSWWTEDCEIVPGLGGRLDFRFDESRVVMELEEAEQGRKVVWRCVDHHFAGMDPVDEWVGTRVLWRLEPDPSGGTDLDFAHEGLTEELSCWDACNAGWDRNLFTSLKGYVETGKGVPYQEWAREQGR